MKMNLLALFLLLAIWVVGYEAYQDSKDSTVSEWTNTVKLQRDPHGAALAAYVTYLAREREAKKYVNPTKCPSFTIGDGYDFNGSEFPIKDKTGKLLQLTPEACIERCFKESISDSSINGVTMFRDNTPGCYCERKMSKVYTGKDYRIYKSCLLPAGLTDCPQFAIGDGYHYNGSEVVIKGDLTDAKCVEECKAKKREDSSINGVTVRMDKVTGKPGCFCEKGMTSVITSKAYRIFKTCTLPTDKKDEIYPDSFEEIIEALSE